MAFEKIGKMLAKIFGSRNERLVKGYMSTAVKALDFEEEVKALDDAGLKAKTAEFKQRLADGQQPEDILTEAFAVVREAARRGSQTRQRRHGCQERERRPDRYRRRSAACAQDEGPRRDRDPRRVGRTDPDLHLGAEEGEGRRRGGRRGPPGGER